MQTKTNCDSETINDRWDRHALYNVNEVLDKYGFSKTTLYASIRRGYFPKPRRIGLRRSAWLGRDLNRHDELMLAGALSTEEGKEQLRAEFA